MTIQIARSKRPIEIFLVEDNLEDVFLMQEALKHSRFNIHLSVARDGEEALDHLRYHPDFSGRALPDLILLDLKLPKKDGWEVLSETKDDPAMKQIPILVMTSSQAELDRAAAYDYHANFFMVKPTNLKDLFASVKYIDDFWLKNIA